jgi:hypothetical protein
MIRRIAHELRHHSPFTLVGALTGIAIVALSRQLPQRVSYTIFYVLHPVHVVLSALVTASMYRLYTRRGGRSLQTLWALLVVGYVGSIGIATLSDSVIPFLGELLLGMPNRGVHIGFIEKWWLVNPLAIAGVALAYFLPSTKFPHFGHVLLSTWASVFHILMAAGGPMDALSYMVILVFLFLAVWIPCCVSDIVFPLLFAGGGGSGPAGHGGT